MVPKDLSVTMLPANFVEEIAGRLYISGGGWTKLLRPNTATPVGIAVKLRASERPLDPLSFTLDLVDARERVQRMKSDSSEKTRPVRIRGTMMPRVSEIGKQLEGAIAINLVIGLKAGNYAWRFFIEDRQMANWPFEVLAAPTTARRPSAATTTIRRSGKKKTA